MMPEEINWERVRELCLTSFRGLEIGTDNMRYLTKAHKVDPERYRVEGEAVRREERFRIQRSGVT